MNRRQLIIIEKALCHYLEYLDTFQYIKENVGIEELEYLIEDIKECILLE